MDWLAREEGGLDRGTIEQRGAGDAVLCQRCNNNTGSWYGCELVRAAHAGANMLGQLPLDELDSSLEHEWVKVVFKQQAKVGTHPLRFIKQIVAMLLATSPYDFSVKNPELGDFVLERERTGLDSKYQIYLALVAGRSARTTGVASRMSFDTGRIDILVEVAYPPFAYVMAIDSEPEAIETANITALRRGRLQPDGRPRTRHARRLRPHTTARGLPDEGDGRARARAERR
jgi:hypothetical protein